MATSDDERLDELVREAYERMSPTPEAEDRMLAALLAHADGATEGANEQAKAERQLTVVEGSKAVRGRRRPWLVALPAAACLVLALVVGRFVTQGSGSAAPKAADAAAESVEAEMAVEEAAPEAVAGTDAGGVAYSTLVTNDEAKVTTEGPAEAEADAFAEEEALAEEDAYAPFVSVVLPDGTVLVPVEGAEPLFDYDECGTQLGEFVATLPNGDEEPCEVWERAGVEGEWLVRPSSMNGMWRAVAQEG